MDNSSFLKYGAATVVVTIAAYLSMEKGLISSELNQKVLASLRRAENKFVPEPTKVASDCRRYSLIITLVVMNRLQWGLEVA